MKYFENFNSFNNKNNNLIIISEYTILLSEILKNIKEGLFNKPKLIQLLSLSNEIDTSSIPFNIKTILFNQRKDFKTLSLVINKLSIKRSDYNNKLSEKEILKNWIMKYINVL